MLFLGLAVGTVGIVETAMITDGVEETVLEDQQETAVQEKTALENWDDRNEQLLLSASKAPFFESGADDEAIEDYLQDVYHDLPEETRSNAVYVDTETGDILAGSGTDAGSLEELAFPDTGALEDDISEHVVQRTEPYGMSDETELAFEERPVRSYYLAVGEDEDRALVFTFNLADRSLEMASSTQLDTVVTIVDDEGRIVADDAFLGYDDYQDGTSFGVTYPDENVLEQARADSPGAMLVEREPGDVLTDAPYEFDADEYVVGYQTTDEGWTVLVHTSEQQALGLVNSIGQFGALVTAGAVLLIGLVGAVIGRNTAVSIDRLTEKAQRMEEGDLEVDLESERIDSIGQLYDRFDSMRVELKETIEEVERERERAETERERVAQLNTHLERKADEYSDVMQSAADGDLTVRMDSEADNEAMSDIAAEFNEMLGEIEATIDRLTQFATDVATASEQVTASSEEVRTASQEVSESIQEISDGAERQHQSLQSVDTQMNNLSTTTQQIAASSNDVADIAERTARTLSLIH
ncbi:methyl-accepting chemotaxis sensory transducer, partial [Halobiforma nitratireducens JCM 10879]